MRKSVRKRIKQITLRAKMSKRIREKVVQTLFEIQERAASHLYSPVGLQQFLSKSGESIRPLRVRNSGIHGKIVACELWTKRGKWRIPIAQTVEDYRHAEELSF